MRYGCICYIYVSDCVEPGLELSSNIGTFFFLTLTFNECLKSIYRYVNYYFHLDLLNLIFCCLLTGPAD